MQLPHDTYGTESEVKIEKPFEKTAIRLPTYGFFPSLLSAELVHYSDSHASYTRTDGARLWSRPRVASLGLVR